MVKDEMAPYQDTWGEKDYTKNPYKVLRKPLQKECFPIKEVSYYKEDKNRQKPKKKSVLYPLNPEP